MTAKSSVFGARLTSNSFRAEMYRSAVLGTPSPVGEHRLFDGVISEGLQGLDANFANTQAQKVPEAIVDVKLRQYLDQLVLQVGQDIDW